MKFVLDKITRLSLRFRAVTILLVFVLMSLGVTAWTQLNQELLPPIEIPQTIILTQTGGMTSEQVLTLITRPLEARLSQIDDIINIQSETRSTVGSFITAFNDFGLDQQALRREIREALREVWLPVRTLESEQPAALINELDAQVLLYIAERDSNFLFNLTPELWAALSDQTLEQLLAYLARQLDDPSSTASALQRLVEKEIAPQLAAIPNVARVAVSGGETLPEEGTAATPTPAAPSEPTSLLLRLSGEVWSVAAARLGLGELDQAAVDRLAALPLTIPQRNAPPPALPMSWQVDAQGTPTRFRDASDLLEMVGFTRPAATVLNNFLREGRITGALGKTDDLTVEVVERVLSLDPTMAAYFDAEQILAMPEDVFAYLVSRDDFLENLDGFTRDAIAARIMAATVAGVDPATITRTPITLPNAWRVQPPQLITFSFSDIPLATFSVYATGAILEPAATPEAAEGASPAATPEPSEAEPAATPAPAQNLVTSGLNAVLGLFSGQPSQPTDAAPAPALNAEWAEFGRLLASFANINVELDTADDLLNPSLGLPFVLPQLMNIPNAADLLGGLWGNLPVDAARYLLEAQPRFFSRLPQPMLVFLSDEVRALLPEDTRAQTPGALLPAAWETLFAQAGRLERAFLTTDDLLALDAERSPSAVLNQINRAPVAPALGSYKVRLMDSLTPRILQVFAAAEPDFFARLDAEVLLEFNSEALNLLTEAQINALPNVSAEEAARLLVIRRDPSESAFAQLASLYATDIPPADPAAPALNPGWQNLGNFYNIELDSADDFFRFPEGFPFPDGAQLINSLFGNAQGENAAVGWLGGFPAEAVVYIQNRDPEFFFRVSNRGLALLGEEARAALPEELQARAVENEVTYRPRSQVTRTNGSESLLITVFKDADANTVSTFAEVQRLLNAIDERDPNIEVGVVFEQSSFIEQSIEGVAREGSLGAVFAVIIILVFLSGGTWNLKGRRLVGSLMTVIFAALLLLLVASNLGAAGGDWGRAFDLSDTVFRVLLIVGVIAGLFVLAWPGNVPDPAWRATLVIAVSIPLSIMTALVGMYWVAPTMHGLIAPLAGDGGFFDFLLRLFPDDLTLNIMTLSGLTVAVGRVVDDSIVVLENIFRQLQQTASKNATDLEKRAVKREAVLQGTRDVSAAIFTATLIAASVFLPLGLTGGLIGAFFLPFGLAVTYSLVGSLVVAITVIPVLAYLFIDINDIPEESELWLARYYRPLLRLSLKNGFTKAVVVVVALMSIGVAGALFAQRPFAFLPNFGEPQISISVNLPSGTSIFTTNELVEALEAWVTTNIGPERITAMQTTVGGAGASFEALLTGNSVAENRAALTIGVAVSEQELAALTKEVELEAKRIFNTCPASSAPANSPEQRALMQVAEVDSALDIVCADGQPINSHVNVSAASIADGGFGGFALVVSGPLTTELNAKVIDAINSIEGISRAQSNFVEAGSGASATFIRINQVEAFSYSAELTTENTIGVTQLALEAIRAIPEIAANLCEGSAREGCFVVSQGFESEVQTEGFQSIGVAMVLAVGLVVIILSATMQSFVYWLAIVFSILVAPIGAAIALTLTDRVLGISAMIGLLMLIGLVIANGVVLIDRVRSNRRERGMALYDALIEAGGRRLRPILMTSLSTIIALTPLAIGLSEGAIIASELGTVVIGGVVSSTVLTLIVVPVMFSVLSPVHRLLSIRKDAETR